MIVDHTNPGMVNDMTALVFSNEEKQRIQEICEELKEIFMAQSVGVYGEMSMNLPVNYRIDIVGCPPAYKYEVFYE